MSWPSGAQSLGFTRAELLPVSTVAPATVHSILTKTKTMNQIKQLSPELLGRRRPRLHSLAKPVLVIIFNTETESSLHVHLLRSLFVGLGFGSEIRSTVSALQFVDRVVLKMFLRSCSGTVEKNTWPESLEIGV